MPERCEGPIAQLAGGGRPKRSVRASVRGLVAEDPFTVAQALGREIFEPQGAAVLPNRGG